MSILINFRLKTTSSFIKYRHESRVTKWRMGAIERWTKIDQQIMINDDGVRGMEE